MDKISSISMVEPVNKVKRTVEDWRELVLLGDSVLGWDKEWFPAVTAGSLTVMFLTVWYSEPSLLPLLSLLGLFLTLADYLGPRVLDKVFPEDSWSADKEARLEDVARSLVRLSNLLQDLGSSLAGLRTSNPLSHFALTSVILLVTAYLGSIFSGLFIAYINMLGLLMLPGLHRRGLLQKYCSSLTDKLSNMVKGKKLE